MNKLSQLLKKLQEPSTIKGMIIIAGIFGVVFTPEMERDVVLGIAAIYSIIQIFVSKD